MDFNEAPESDIDRPGIYYVNVYHAQPDGTLADSTTRLSYRARNSDVAIKRAKIDYPLAMVVGVDFHQAIEAFEIADDDVDVDDSDSELSVTHRRRRTLTNKDMT